MRTLEIQIFLLENSIGFAINKRLNGQLVPLTQYYLWPVSEVLEQIGVELELKVGISKTEQTDLLNLVVETIDLWRKARDFEPSNLFSDEKGLKAQVNLIGFS